MLQQSEAVFFSAQSEADANSLTQHYFMIRVRGFRNRVPILPVAGLQSAENPHLPVETVLLEQPMLLNQRRSKMNSSTVWHCSVGADQATEMGQSPRL